MGQARYYMAPAGVIGVLDLPDNWGLLEVHGRRVLVVAEAARYPLDPERCAAELPLLYSFARRAQLGVEPTVGCLVKPPRDTPT